MKPPILLISYFTSIRGMVMAEWADDKIRVLEASGYRTIVITGISSGGKNNNLTKYIKIPPLSWREFQFERTQIKDQSMKLKIFVAIFSPISMTVGRLFDSLTQKIITRENPARWSWVFSALPFVAYLQFRHRIKTVFATGGALSGQFLASLLRKGTKTRVFIEYQDPIVGNQIVRSSANDHMMRRLEKFITRRTYKTFFVTEGAAQSAVTRNQELESKISFAYPGSWSFGINHPKKTIDKGLIRLMHIGTLYGTRSMDNLFTALDKIRESDLLENRKITVTNVGSLYLDNANEYLMRDDFIHIPELEREDALKLASTADILLLIQHQDDRSIETIPYKTYDYLNLGNKILGLTKNVELDKIILKSNGVVAKADSVPQIINALESLLELQKYIKQETQIEKLDIKKQFLSLLELDNQHPVKTHESNTP